MPRKKSTKVAQGKDKAPAKAAAKEPKRELAYLDVLDIFIKMYKESGCPPPLSIIQELTGLGPFVRKAMKRLLDEGYVMQPYRGCYRPLKNSKGVPVSISVCIGVPKPSPSVEPAQPAAPPPDPYGLLESDDIKVEGYQLPSWMGLITDFGKAMTESIRMEVEKNSPDVDEETLSALVAAVWDEKLKEFSGPWTFRFEETESRIRKLTETVLALREMPDNLRAAQDEVEVLREQMAAQVGKIKSLEEWKGRLVKQMAAMFS